MRSAQEIAGLLQELADRVVFAQEGQWKSRAYSEAARRIADGSVDLSRPTALEDAPGIGVKIGGKIRRMLEGELPASLVRLRADQPPELSALLRLPGVGPSTARKLWAEGIGRVGELEAKLRAGTPLPGISPSQRTHLLRAFSERRLGVPLPELMAASAALMRSLRGVQPAGALRRLDPTVKDPQWFAPGSADNRRAWLEMQPFALPSGFTLGPKCLRFVEESVLGAALLAATGPAAFLEELQRALERRGLRMTPQGIFEGGTLVPCATEEEVFRGAGMEAVPPTLRGLDPARRAAAPRTVQGDLHTHSTWSDGAESIATMAAAAVARGYSYLAVTDHSQGLKVANGLTPERYRAQRQEIRDVQRSLPEGFRLLQGCEVDIHSDGSLDLPDDLLSELDVVIASVHGQFDQGVEEATMRLVRAIRHPLVTAIGHPGARKLGLRPPIAADWGRVFAAAREAGTALELNASPRRLDLDYRWLGDAGAQGLRFLIDTDAHSVEELGYMPLGIAQAQKAGVAAKDILNAGPVEDVLRRPARR
ncbi:MAG: PHP domain-containing protein [Thermaerobacter sp.]|nr:PHP domain-containing protein [Thermaerobacter sp.]